MNPGRPSLWQRLRLWVPYIILFGWFCMVSTMFVFLRVSGDFRESYYVPGIPPTDWFPPMIWGQLRLFDMLWPGEYDAQAAGVVFMAVWLFMLLLACTMVTRHLIREGKSPLSFLICVVGIINPMCFDTFFVSSDMAVAYLICLALSLLYVSKLKFWGGRYFALVLFIIFASMHRANAIVLIPVLCVYAACIPRYLQNGCKKTLLSSVLTIATAVFCVCFINYKLIGASKVHAEKVMLQSDIYCMDLMKGVSPCSSAGERLQCGPFSRSRGNENEVCAQFALIHSQPNDAHGEDVAWRIWKDEWWQHIEESPRRFLMLRTILTWQFFAQGRCPEFLRHWVYATHPGENFTIRSSPDGVPIIPAKIMGDEWGGLPRNIYTIAYLISLAVFPFLFVKNRKDFVKSDEFRLSVAAYAVSLFYTLSLIPFVPTPDSRFLAPSFAAWAFALGAYLTYRRDKKVRE